MADVIPLDEFDRKPARERARVEQAMRDLADRIETAPRRRYVTRSRSRRAASTS
jgi:hypothetical protein